MLKDLGFREGINEIIGVTFNGRTRNSAPLGIIVDDEESNRAMLRLFYRKYHKSGSENVKTHTMENVERGSNIYANVCFDPVVFAVSAFEDLGDEFFESEFILKNAYSVCVFEVIKIRKGDIWLCELEAADGWIVNPRAARAFSRGLAAVVETAIHATRYCEGRKREELKKKILEAGDLIERCGGKREREAYEYLLKATGLDRCR